MESGSAAPARRVTAAFQVLPCVPSSDSEIYRKEWLAQAGGKQKVGGHQIAPWLAGLGFERGVLRAAWAAVDTSNVGEIDEAQFVVLLRLLQLHRAGVVSQHEMSMDAVTAHLRVVSGNPLAPAANAPPPGSQDADGDDDFGDFEEPVPLKQASASGGNMLSSVGDAEQVPEENPFDVFTDGSAPTVAEATHPAGAINPPKPALSDAFASLLSPMAAPPAPSLGPSLAASAAAPSSATATAHQAAKGEMLPPFTPLAGVGVSTAGNEWGGSNGAAHPADDEDDFGDFEGPAFVDAAPPSAADAPPSAVQRSAAHQSVPVVPLLDMLAPLPRGTDELTIITCISAVASEVDDLARDVAYIKNVAHGRSDQLRGTPGEGCHPEHLVEYVNRLCTRADEVATRCLLRLDGIARTEDTRALRKAEVRRVNEVIAPLDAAKVAAQATARAALTPTPSFQHSATAAEPSPAAAASAADVAASDQQDSQAAAVINTDQSLQLNFGEVAAAAPLPPLGTSSAPPLTP